MLKQILTTVTLSLYLVLPAQAFSEDQSPIPQADHHRIENLIKNKLERVMGSKSIKNFNVDWKITARECVKVESEMNPEAELGVCVVSAQGFQLDSKIAIIKKIDHYAISIIYIDKE